VIHADTYHAGTDDEIREAVEVMNPIAARGGQPGDWARLMNAYFGARGSMAKREPVLRAALDRQALAPTD
jgi:hypothetical protein